jgi:hypothetical protein
VVINAVIEDFDWRDIAIAASPATSFLVWSFLDDVSGQGFGQSSPRIDGKRIVNRA